MTNHFKLMTSPLALLIYRVIIFNDKLFELPERVKNANVKAELTLSDKGEYKIDYHAKGKFNYSLSAKNEEVIKNLNHNTAKLLPMLIMHTDQSGHCEFDSNYLVKLGMYKSPKTAYDYVKSQLKILNSITVKVSSDDKVLVSEPIIRSFVTDKKIFRISFSHDVLYYYKMNALTVPAKLFTLSSRSYSLAVCVMFHLSQNKCFAKKIKISIRSVTAGMNIKTKFGKNPKEAFVQPIYDAISEINEKLGIIMTLESDKIVTAEDHLKNGYIYAWINKDFFDQNELINCVYICDKTGQSGMYTHYYAEQYNSEFKEHGFIVKTDLVGNISGLPMTVEIKNNYKSMPEIVNCWIDTSDAHITGLFLDEAGVPESIKPYLLSLKDKLIDSIYNSNFVSLAAK